MAPDVYQPPVSSAVPRLRLNSTQQDGAIVDGGWWPRSGDPAQELPGLLLALEDHRFPIHRLELGVTGWRDWPAFLLLTDRAIHLSWSLEFPPDLLVAIGPDDARTNLLVVPPNLSVFTARAALDLAALTTNTAHTSEIMDAAGLYLPPPRTTPEMDWESEGGRLYDGDDPPTSSPLRDGTRVAVQRESAGPDWTLIRVSGEIDLITAPDYLDRLLAMLHPGAGRVVADLSGVTFFSAAGVWLLAAGWNRAESVGADFRLAGPTASVRRILDLVGVRGLPPVHATVEGALTHERE